MKISILCFDLSSNAFGRAWLLAQTLSRAYDVEIIGASRKGGIWAPMGHSKIFFLILENFGYRPHMNSFTGILE